MKAKELRGKSDEELRTLADELAQQVFRLRFRKATEQLKKTSDLRATKRDLARVKTLLRERERGLRPAASAAPAGGGEE